MWDPSHLSLQAIKAELGSWDFLKIRETGPSKGLLASSIVNNKLRMEYSAL